MIPKYWVQTPCIDAYIGCSRQGDMHGSVEIVRGAALGRCVEMILRKFLLVLGPEHLKSIRAFCTLSR